MVKNKNTEESVENRFYLLFKFVQIVWFLSIVFVAYLSLTPQVELPLHFIGIDKVYHSIAYLWLAAIPFFGFHRNKFALAGALLMIPFGIGLEYAQGFVVGRYFSVADMIANGAGVALGVALGRHLKFCFLRVTKG